MTETLLADCSSWQPNINDRQYASWSKAIIVRAMFGTTIDGAWYNGQRCAALRAAGMQFIGLYQYLVTSQSATVQAAALVHLLGDLQDGEIPICDLEEGEDCAARWQEWRDVILAAYPHLARTTAGRPWLYSGEDFAAENGLAPDWIAAYSDQEPAGPHILWQFSQTYDVPGIGYPVDCSLFHGTVGELAALVAPRSAPPPPKPPVIQEDDDVNIQLTESGQRSGPLPVWADASAAGESGGYNAATLTIAGDEGTSVQVKAYWDNGHVNLYDFECKVSGQVDLGDPPAGMVALHALDVTRTDNVDGGIVNVSLNRWSSS
jgi:GH25 family lysozyme M1 (1,4-beta-N-acetylmuramidase)